MTPPSEPITEAITAALTAVLVTVALTRVVRIMNDLFDDARTAALTAVLVTVALVTVAVVAAACISANRKVTEMRAVDEFESAAMEAAKKREAAHEAVEALMAAKAENRDVKSLARVAMRAVDEFESAVATAKSAEATAMAKIAKKMKAFDSGVEGSKGDGSDDKVRDTGSVRGRTDNSSAATIIVGADNISAEGSNGDGSKGDGSDE